MSIPSCARARRLYDFSSFGAASERDEVMLGFSSARMIKLAEWKHKKLVKHHSLNNLNMESDFREHLSLFKEVLHDQLIGIAFYPICFQMRIVSPFDCHS